MSFKSFTTTTLITAGLSAALCAPLAAQNADQTETAAQKITPAETRGVVRITKPIPYWVDADKLSIRNNPVAGDVTGVLNLGHKVKAYTRFENWVRISPDNKPEAWVNTDFLTTQEVSWANYSFSGRKDRRVNSRRVKAFDVDLRRIEVESDSKARIVAARITELPNRNRLITTKQSFREGPYFEKRLVSCGASGDATGQQLVAEGHTYLMMDRDVRARNVAALTPAKISADTTDIQTAVAKFACTNLPN